MSGLKQKQRLKKNTITYTLSVNGAWGLMGETGMAR